MGVQQTTKLNLAEIRIQTLNQTIPFLGDLTSLVENNLSDYALLYPFREFILAIFCPYPGLRMHVHHLSFS